MNAAGNITNCNVSWQLVRTEGLRRLKCNKTGYPLLQAPSEQNLVHIRTDVTPELTSHHKRPNYTRDRDNCDVTSNKHTATVCGGNTLIDINRAPYYCRS